MARSKRQKADFFHSGVKAGSKELYDLLRAVAHHEAGHCVTCHYLLPNGDKAGIDINTDPVNRQITGVDFDEIASSSPTNYLVMLYAGTAAELRFDPSREEEARCWAEIDEDAADRVLDESGMKPEQGAELRTRAADFVAEHWKEIQEVAAALLVVRRGGILTGTEVSLAIKSAMHRQMKEARDGKA